MELTDVTSIIQTAAVTCGLVFAGFQLAGLRRTLSTTAHWNRVQAVNMIHNSLASLNTHSRQEGVDYCVLRFNHLSLVQTIRDEDLLSPEDWVAELDFMAWAIQQPGMREVWPKCKGMYRASFAATIERLWEAAEGAKAPERSGRRLARP